MGLGLQIGNKHLFLFVCLCLFLWPCRLWDFSFITRDQTRALSSESTES